MKLSARTLLLSILLIQFLATLALTLGLANYNNQLHQYIIELIIALFLLFIFLQLLAVHRLNKTVFAPLTNLESGIEIILKTHASHQLELPEDHALGELPEGVHALGDEIASIRAEISSALRSGAKKLALQKEHLERVIQGLEQGVLVCDSQARQLLYNPAADRILKQHPAFGLGRSLYDLLPKSSIEHALARLDVDSDTGFSFISTVSERGILLNCRIGLLPIDTPANDEPVRTDKAFVITFSDVTARQNRLHQRDQLFTSALESLRRPVANLRAAAETLTTFDDISRQDRQRFSQVISDESLKLTVQLDHLAENERALVGQEWQLTDIYSDDLANILSHHTKERHDVNIHTTGDGQWLTTDSQALVALLEYLSELIEKKRSVKSFELEAIPRRNGVYLDLSWQGSVLSHNDIENCLTDNLTTVVGQPTIGELINQLGAEIWSQAQPNRDGYAVVRIPLPAPITPNVKMQSSGFVARPMRYDFDLLEDRFQHTLLLDKPLRKLDFVVFDTETTGLHPETGDEVVSIAAVRIVNQRLLTEETFDQLVNPGRHIPQDSIRFHGITDEMVADAPSIVAVLPQFKAFTKNAVLVAHSAWFDMTFIRRSEAKSRSYFSNPVLDTLMLSVCLHGHDVDQSLDGIAARLGVDVVDRHTALGDSFTTAKVLLSQIDLLEARGIITLKDALDAYR